MERYVITGGPGTGKTTVCAALASLGLSVVPEAARHIIEQEQQKPGGVLPWTDLSGFQQLVYRRQIEAETRAEGSPAFCDRGIVDNLGHCAAGGIGPPAELERLVATHRYSGVFVLDHLATYVMDAQRREDAAEGRRLHAHLIDAYRSAGYEPVIVPAFAELPRPLSIASRVKYILERVGEDAWRQYAAPAA